MLRIEIKHFSRLISIKNTEYITDKKTNLSKNILNLVNRDILHIQNHPLHFLKKRIENFFNQEFPNKFSSPSTRFTLFDNISPVVTEEQNFDSLLVPINHISRSSSDTFYINETHLLRSHTSAHQSELIRNGLNSFLIAGDVYRRDEVDRTHYPAFHQIEGVRLFNYDQLFDNVKDYGNCIELFEDDVPQEITFNQEDLPVDKQVCHTLETKSKLEFDLKKTLERMIESLFRKKLMFRWVDAYFPFTHPSWELEICEDPKTNKWLEVLGCGVMRQEILKKNGVSNRVGWAFGLGLERIAMHLFSIPDIRIFWTQDPGFFDQFPVEKMNENIQYKLLSNFPACPYDVSFWLPKVTSDARSISNDLFEIVRDLGEDLVERVNLKDDFYDAKNDRRSLCFTITYRSCERNLTHEEVGLIHKRITEELVHKLRVTIR